MGLDGENDHPDIIQLRVDMMFAGESRCAQELNRISSTQGETVNTANRLLLSLERAINAMDAQQQQLGVVDNELWTQLIQTRRERVSQADSQQSQTREAAQEIVRTQEIISQELRNAERERYLRAQRSDQSNFPRNLGRSRGGKWYS